MRYILALLAVAGILAPVFAQSLPACAQQCAATADLGGCVSTDTSCLCRNSAFIQSTTQCILTNCHGQDITDAETIAQAACAAVGITLTSTPPIPTSTGGTGSSAPAASGSPTSAAASTSASATKPASSAAASSATATSAPASGGAISHGVNGLVAAAALGLAAWVL